MRSAVFGLLGSVALLATAACSQPSNKSDLKVCTAGQDGCPSADPTHPKGGTGSHSEEQTSAPPSAGPPSAPAQSAPKTEPKDSQPKTPDPLPAPSIGPSCAKLATCCDYMDTNGIYSQFCHDTLTTNDETQCDEKVQTYLNDPEGGQYCP